MSYLELWLTLGRETRELHDTGLQTPGDLKRGCLVRAKEVSTGKSLIHHQYPNVAWVCLNEPEMREEMFSSSFSPSFSSPHPCPLLDLLFPAITPHYNPIMLWVKEVLGTYLRTQIPSNNLVAPGKFL